ncbi:MAG: hypothetical protein AB7O43_12075 [Hyphomicrobiaceae bacterium]
MSEAREKFVRLAEARTQKAIDAIQLIGNLSNPTNYSYNDKDVEQIFRALGEAVKDARSRFKATTSREKSNSFRLDR